MTLFSHIFLVDESFLVQWLLETAPSPIFVNNNSIIVDTRVLLEIDSMKDVTIGTSTSYTKLPTDTPSPKKLPYGTVVKVESGN